MCYKKFDIKFLFIFLFPFYLFSQNIVEKEIAIYTYPDSLYGSLILNNNKTLCIIHPGSGPTDRNGNNDFGVESNYLMKLADSLSAHNISTFRFDKRGVGKSKDALVSEDSLTIYSYVNDLLLLIDYFSKPPYSFKNFVLIGHSEGALISTLAAQKSKKVKKLILLNGMGFRGDTIIKIQLSNLHENAKKIIFPIIDSLSKGKRVDNVPPMLSFLFRESVQNYMISFLSIDPAVELSKVNIPTLIIQGENDMQISISDANRLKSFKKDAELKFIPNMNHILVDAPNDKKLNTETYKNPNLPLSKDLIPTIVGFVIKK